MTTTSPLTTLARLPVGFTLTDSCTLINNGFTRYYRVALVVNTADGGYHIACEWGRFSSRLGKPDFVQTGFQVKQVIYYRGDALVAADRILKGKLGNFYFIAYWGGMVAELGVHDRPSRPVVFVDVQPRTGAGVTYF